MKYKIQPFSHQLVDIQALVDHECYGLFSEMGTGKSATVVNAACELASLNKIDCVLVVSPAAVRGVWSDPDLGEVRKHSWLVNDVWEYSSSGGIKRRWRDDGDTQLLWVVTNYEYVRSVKHQEQLIGMLSKFKVMMVLDESSFIKSCRAERTKACYEISKISCRRIILNGTPISNGPLDLWSQVRFLSSKILPYQNFFHFRYNYTVRGGWKGKQVVGYKNLEQLQELIAPYVVRREKKDCLDLPEKLYTTLEVPLEQSSWQVYKQMRDDAVAWLDDNPSMAAQAGVKMLRLAQITSGFLGGFDPDDVLATERPDPKSVGHEKVTVLVEWLKERLVERPNLKLIVWCRFRAEIERATKELSSLLATYKLYGGQPRGERDRGVEVFSRVEAGAPASVLVAQPQAGGFGLNLVAADVNVYLSNDFNLTTRLQSEDRTHRPGQKRSVLYVDVLATGPKGQRTVDHEVVKALRAKDDVARWTTSAWKKALAEERDDQSPQS